MATYCIPNGGLGNFLHLILQSYGFSPLQTILVGLPQAAAQVFIALSGSYIARRFRNSRTLVMVSRVCPWCMRLIDVLNTSLVADHLRLALARRRFYPVCDAEYGSLVVRVLHPPGFRGGRRSVVRHARSERDGVYVSLAGGVLGGGSHKAEARVVHI